jgi:thioredoxin-like negative regulator of GroEL
VTPRSEPDTALARSAGFAAVVVGFAFLIIGFALARLLGLTGFGRVACALAVAAAAGWMVRRLPLAIAEGAGRFVLAIVQPEGRATPYEPEFSQAQSLAAAGDVSSALALYEHEMARHPANEIVRIQAAELYAKAGDARRAESLFLEVRELTADRGRELYAMQRLIDLRIGALAEPARALGELRRVIDRFPGTAEAEGARRALGRLKEQVAAQGDRAPASRAEQGSAD